MKRDCTISMYIIASCVRERIFSSTETRVRGVINNATSLQDKQKLARSTSHAGGNVTIRISRRFSLSALNALLKKYNITAALPLHSRSGNDHLPRRQIPDN